LYSEYAEVAAAEGQGWLAAGAKGAPAKAPAFLFPRAQVYAAPTSGPPPWHAEAFFGLCDLPEMMALRCESLLKCGCSRPRTS
jgi:hypothetical protein